MWTETNIPIKKSLDMHRKKEDKKRDNSHTVPHRVLDCRPDLGELNQVDGPNRPTAYVRSICGNFLNIFTTCTNRNQHDILKTTVADVSKGQTDMSYKGELQTLTKQSMRHQICPSETCFMTIFISFHIQHRNTK